MPVTKQAIKKVRQDKRKAEINALVKKAFKKSVHDFRKNPSNEKLVLVYRTLDKAAKSNVIHHNKAARIKSRLSKMVSNNKSSKSVASASLSS